MEIKIEGPIHTYEVIDRMDSILKDPRWDRELSEEEKKHAYDKTSTFSKILENTFLNLIQEIRDQPFRKPPVTGLVGMKTMLISRDFLWTIYGNIAKIDKTKMITQILEQAKTEATGARVKPLTPPPPPKPFIKSCSTYFYPPIWVGKLPRRTFTEKAHHAFIFPKKALDLRYKDRVVIISEDGLIAMGEEKIPKATRMLNEVMATFLLMGFEASAVQELEVCDAKIDPSSLTITQWGTRVDTPRTQLAHFFPQQRLMLESRTEIGRMILLA